MSSGGIRTATCGDRRPCCSHRRRYSMKANRLPHKTSLSDNTLNLKEEGYFAWQGWKWDLNCTWGRVCWSNIVSCTYVCSARPHRLALWYIRPCRIKNGTLCIQVASASPRSTSHWKPCAGNLHGQSWGQRWTQDSYRALSIGCEFNYRRVPQQQDQDDLFKEQALIHSWHGVPLCSILHPAAKASLLMSPSAPNLLGTLHCIQIKSKPPSWSTEIHCHPLVSYPSSSDQSASSHTSFLSVLQTCQAEAISRPLNPPLNSSSRCLQCSLPHVWISAQMSPYQRCILLSTLHKIEASCSHSVTYR